MEWTILFDFIIDTITSNKDITSAISNIFSVQPGEIYVTFDITEERALLEDKKIIIEKNGVTGEFKMLIRLYLHDKLDGESSEKVIATKLCKHLKCRCLISDDSINPCTMLLINHHGETLPVSLDPQRLENDEYYIK
jgi:hypothetical protein